MSLSHISFTAGGSDEVEVKNQLTKIETVGHHVQIEDIVQQQGVCTSCNIKKKCYESQEINCDWQKLDYCFCCEWEINSQKKF